MKPDNIRKIIKKGVILRDEPMSAHTTFRTGGPAKWFIIPADEEEASALIRYLYNNLISYYVVGNGSNLLVSDKGYDGVIVNIGRNDGTDFVMLGYEEQDNKDEVLFDAGAGCLMSVLGKIAAQLSCTGFEPLSGIPGCIGGAVYMNAGAYGGEIKDIITAVSGIDRKGNKVRFEKDELSFRYRGSSLQDDGIIITRAEYVLKKGDPEKISSLMDELTAKRKEKQPLELPSAGSTFKRPEGYFAGKLIEDAGLKGFRTGGASVSEKHAGFVVNDKNATSADIFNLIREIQNRVYASSGVMLEPEVKMLGDFS